MCSFFSLTQLLCDGCGGGTMMELLSVAGTRIVSGRRGGGGGVVYLKVER